MGDRAGFFILHQTIKQKQKETCKKADLLNIYNIKISERPQQIRCQRDQPDPLLHLPRQSHLRLF
jgi:hypothetical protein